jgi:flavin-dependent dehydrogenase
VSGERGRVEAAFALDCSGRTGVIATRGFRVQERRQRTIAIVGVWRCESGWGLPDESHTLVETYGDGWAWSVPISATDRYVTVMVNPGVTSLERGSRIAAAYDAELRKTRHLSALVARASPQAPVWSCDASLYGAKTFAGPGFLLVGDSGSFIEPLSSFGVKKAIASAWVAAVVVHTCLIKPEMRDTALEFYSARERRVHAAYQRQSAQFFEEAARTHQHSFWSDRFTDLDLAGRAQEDGATDVEALREDPLVLAAFEALKAAPGIRLRRTPHVMFARRAAIEDREVVLEERIVEPRLPGAADGVRYLRGVDLPLLIRMSGDYAQVPALFEG